MRRLLSLSLGVVVCCIATAATAKTLCNTPDEISAVQVRQLQIEMMVSTMRCDSSTYDFRHRYAAFMGQMDPLLTDNAKRLKVMLKRHKKGDVDHYITTMSNDAQNISQQDPNFCPGAVQILEHVATLSPKEIPGFAAQSIPSPYQVTACPAKPEHKSKPQSRH